MITPASLDELLSLREDTDFEAKAAQGRHGEGEIPQSVWETYSAMANTSGGVILLGAKEDGSGSLQVVGLKDPAKVRKALWDNLNNRKQVSVNLLVDNDVQICEIDKYQVLFIHVPRAHRQQRPVYIGSNPLTGTFRRNYEGDYRCDEATVRRMLADSHEDARDATILPHFGLDDIDSDSFAAYRNEFKSTKPGHLWLGLDDVELLRNIGGWRRDRQTGQEGLTLAGLLMFGKLCSILDEIPHYLVDYQECPQNDPEVRWVDRITTDGTWSGNLFDFYRRSYAKLIDGLKVPFRLEGGHKRIDETHVHEALREALVNTLIHADYAGSIGILVLKYPDRFIFRNPGMLRLPKEEVLKGGSTDCRNRALQKMFQFCGGGDQAGSGIPKIYRAWREQHWREPLLEEQVLPEMTRLSLPMVSLLPRETLDELDMIFGTEFRMLSETERLAVATASIEGQVTNERLRQITTAHPRDLTYLLRGLVSRGYLHSDGIGRGTVYHLHSAQPTQLTIFDGPANTPLSEHLSGNSEHLSGNSEHLPGNSEHLPGNSEHYGGTDQKASESEASIITTISAQGRVPKEKMETAIRMLCRNSYISLRALSEVLHRSPATLRTHYLNHMVKKGELELRFPDKLNHPEQSYRYKGNEQA